MNIDRFEQVLDAETRRIERIMAEEFESFTAPERIRREVEAFARLTPEEQAMLEPSERRRLEELRRKLAREY